MAAFTAPVTKSPKNPEDPDSFNMMLDVPMELRDEVANIRQEVEHALKQLAKESPAESERTKIINRALALDKK